MEKLKRAGIKNINFANVLGILAAGLNIVSGILYQHHFTVVAYNPDTVASGVALWLFCISIVFWALFLILKLKR